jgi:hypothetical protein
MTFGINMSLEANHFFRTFKIVIIKYSGRAIFWSGRNRSAPSVRFWNFFYFARYVCWVNFCNEYDTKEREEWAKSVLLYDFVPQMD